MSVKGDGNVLGLGHGCAKRNHFTAVGSGYCWGKVDVALCVLVSHDAEAREQGKNVPAIDDSATIAG